MPIAEIKPFSSSGNSRCGSVRSAERLTTASHTRKLPAVAVSRPRYDRRDCLLLLTPPDDVAEMATTLADIAGVTRCEGGRSTQGDLAFNGLPRGSARGAKSGAGHCDHHRRLTRSPGAPTHKQPPDVAFHDVAAEALLSVLAVNATERSRSSMCCHRRREPRSPRAVGG